MAIQSIEDIVKRKLAFIPTTGWEADIEATKIEQMYYLDTYLNKDVVDIEDEANWLGMERYLLGDITTYQLVVKEIIETTGGTDTSKPGEGSKMLKKAKADVTEAEFEYAKADDGKNISLKTTSLLAELKQNICRYSQSLGFHLPGYCPDVDKYDVPAFTVFTPEN